MEYLLLFNKFFNAHPFITMFVIVMIGGAIGSIVNEVKTHPYPCKDIDAEARYTRLGIDVSACKIKDGMILLNGVQIETMNANLEILEKQKRIDAI